jgi:hypothetical protein
VAWRSRHDPQRPKHKPNRTAVPYVVAKEEDTTHRPRPIWSPDTYIPRGGQRQDLEELSHGKVVDKVVFLARFIVSSSRYVNSCSFYM